MELKRFVVLYGQSVSYGFNRTFMELKPKSERYDIRRTEGFNRTFMELKRHIINAVRLATVVLIGPSWN